MWSVGRRRQEGPMTTDAAARGPAVSLTVTRVEGETECVSMPKTATIVSAA